MIVSRFSPQAVASHWRASACPPEIVELLKLHKAEQAAERKKAAQLWEEGGWVFTTPVGLPLNPNTDYHEWKQILRDAGLRDGRLHDARHTAATVLLILQVHERAAMGVMGWATTSMAARYQHMTDPIRADIAKRVGGLIWKPAELPPADPAGGAEGSTQYVGQDWGDDSGSVREDRELKHRAKTATRPVPAPPILVRALRWHIAAHGHAPDGRLFVAQGYGCGSVSKETYARIWRAARKAALTSAQQRTPLGKVPYQLRHAAVSLWLNAGVPATQVAEWAGHSVHVLLKVYAKCIEGQDEAARRRIEEALGDVDDPGGAA